MPDVFTVPVFFIVFRETLETVLVVSILLAWLKQQQGPEQDAKTYRKLRNQVWAGTGIGLAICFIIGCGMIGAFYGLGKDTWAGAELIWEGVFAIIASIIISIMGAALLRVSKMQDKWRVKLAKALEARDAKAHTAKGRFKLWCEKYAMFVLPFITIMREGLEAIVFIGGVSLGVNARSIPLPVVTGLAAGSLIGYFIYKGGAFVPIRIFLIVSTCILYLIGAALFSRGVWYFEAHAWNKATGGDAAEGGEGPGGGWGVFNALLGWQNSATYGSVISYNLYWLAVIVGFVALRSKENKGHWPLMKAPVARPGDEKTRSDSSTGEEDSVEGKKTTSKVVTKSG